MKNEEFNTSGNITIATIAKMANVSTATVSYVINERTDKKVAEATRQKILDLCRKFNYQKGATRKRPKNKKPVTINDIAKEAGVSTTTVSYIINNHQDVKIREETRRKVLQICNLRQFLPSSTARALRSPEIDKHNTIGLYFNRPTSTFYHSEECLDLICTLQKFLYERDYKTLLLPPIESNSISIQRDIDGIICIDLSEQQFYTLKESYYVPIVAIDMTIKDSLFFKSYNDFNAIINHAKAQLKTSHLIFVTSKYQNQPYMNKLKRALADDLLYVVSTCTALIEFLRQHKNEHIVFSDISLAICSFPYIVAEKTAVICNNAKITLPSEQMVKIYLPSELKVKNAVEMLEYAIQRKESEPHTFKLSPQSL